ncbi:tyrosine-type recombinase/integrase [Hydrogenophaga laconesensis]|uniref:Site-specific recombinase XerD n=1 Tax=Hydrogenophaga laconesensis TaxID=1805971 RepID=A0ABU1VGV0_9BURK|nr:tyrosine-type recombinase/integrase [Hydrogenophaga laconesensis]MDR7096540.1 site-specific recombinase XerD [Hydrogenophaga laconesensis]
MDKQIGYGRWKAPADVMARAMARMRERERAGGPRKAVIGSGKEALAEAIRRYPNDPLRQLAMFLDASPLPALIGRAREVSAKTRTNHGDMLRGAIGDLKAINMKVQRLDQLNRRQVMALAAYWTHEKGQTPGTVANKLSALRKFFTQVGRQDVVPKREALYEALAVTGVSQQMVTRQQVALDTKAWTPKGVVPLEVIEEVRETYPHEALLMELMLAWGLRVSEALGLRPHSSDTPNFLLVHRETKGGRWRKVPYMKDAQKAAYQRDVLNRCRQWAEKSRRLEMGYPKLTLQQARSRLYNVMAEIGVTLEQRGVVCHGLRHEFAGDMFFDITRHRPPSENGADSDWYKQNKTLVADAYQQVSEALGHWRREISSAYLGSPTKMSKAQRERMEQSMQLIAGNPDVKQGLVAAGVEQFWITGPAADGVLLRAGEAMQVAGRFQEGWTAENLKQVHEVLRAGVARPIQFVVSLEAQPQGETLEIFLDR